MHDVTPMNTLSFFRLFASVALTLLALSGCETDAVDTAAPGDVVAGDSTPQDVATDTEDTNADADITPFTPERCGAAPFAWLPAAQVGQPVQFDEMALTNLSATTIAQLLKNTGYDLGEIRNGARTFKLRYTTQDKGQLTEATALVGVPIGLETAGPVPTILWLHGTTGFMDDCAPSKNELEGAGLVALLASLGYVAIAPDYLGLRGFGPPSPAGSIHSYLVGEATAIASLDAVRAAAVALAKDATLTDPDLQRTIIWGGSQGGHAAFFVDRFQPHYAPEIDVLAVAAAVPATDLRALAVWGANHPGATAITLVAALTAWQQWYGLGDLKEVLANAEPLKLAENVPIWLSTTCKPDVDVSTLKTLSDLYSPEFLTKASAGEFDALTPWGCMISENSVPWTSVPRLKDRPVLVTYSENDELVITETERKSIPELCKQGYRIEYLECAGLGHTDGALASLPYMRKWIDDRVEGKPLVAERNCVIRPAVDCNDPSVMP
jgi:dienelactone hydrolase